MPTVTEVIFQGTLPRICNSIQFQLVSMIGTMWSEEPGGGGTLGVVLKVVDATGDVTDATGLLGTPQRLAAHKIRLVQQVPETEELHNRRLEVARSQARQ